MGLTLTDCELCTVNDSTLQLLFTPDLSLTTFPGNVPSPPLPSAASPSPFRSSDRRPQCAFGGRDKAVQADAIEHGPKVSPGGAPLGARQSHDPGSREPGALGVVLRAQFVQI